MKDSQNGFDNSGKATHLEWTSEFKNKWPEGESATFLHWPIRAAEWMGTFDKETLTYPVINRDNIDHALTAITNLVDRYKDHPAVLGLQPLNEPWEFTPMDELKTYYWDGYLIMKRAAPTWKYVMHDAFLFELKIWGGFMDGCPDRALDTHIYQAWRAPSSRVAFYQEACSWKRRIAEMELAFGPVIVGEWSLATDNCAMWLNGFNDNLPGYPVLPCKFVTCTDPYMGMDQPGTPVDPGQPYLGPYGSGISGPVWGECPVGRDWLKEHDTNVKAGMDWVHAPPEAPPGRDGTDEVMAHLARKKISAFAGVGHGYYFWNFRTDLPEPGWSYLLASERGWIPRGSFETDHIQNACRREDGSEYKCVARRRKNNEKYVRIQVVWALNKTNPDADYSYVDDLSGDALYAEADQVYNAFWQANMLNGTTCDFAGTAELEFSDDYEEGDDEFDDTWTPDDTGNGEDDDTVSKHDAVMTGFIGLLVGCLIGFIIAMKSSRSFNVAVRRSVMPSSMKNSEVFTSNNSLVGSEKMPMIV